LADFCDGKKESLYGTRTTNDDGNVTWKEVAVALDKVCFVIYVLYFVILSVSIILSVQV